METQPSSPIAHSLRLIHRAITRGLAVSIAEGERFAQSGFPDDDQRDGYGKYLQALAGNLDAHHTTEDDLVFPDFRAMLPQVPYGALAEQHQEISRLLEQIGQAAGGGLGSAGDVVAVLAPLRSIQELWLPHIRIEEEHFSTERIDGLLPLEEQMRMSAAYGEYSQRHSPNPELTVPFVLYNLEPAERAGLERGMPAEVLQHLLPVVWRESWKNMDPFLLP